MFQVRTCKREIIIPKHEISMMAIKKFLRVTQLPNSQDHVFHAAQTTTKREQSHIGLCGAFGYAVELLSLLPQPPGTPPGQRDRVRDGDVTPVRAINVLPCVV